MMTYIRYLFHESLKSLSLFDVFCLVDIEKWNMELPSLKELSLKESEKLGNSICRSVKRLERFRVYPGEYTDNYFYLLNDITEKQLRGRLNLDVIPSKLKIKEFEKVFICSFSKRDEERDKSEEDAKGLSSWDEREANGSLPESLSLVFAIEWGSFEGNTFERKHLVQKWKLFVESATSLVERRG